MGRRHTHKVPKGDGTFTEVLRDRLKLKEDAVTCLLPGLSILLFDNIKNEMASHIE